MSKTDTTISHPQRENIVDLPDGRTLGTASWGDEDAPTIFWFHGTPGARRQVPQDARKRAEAGEFRVIGIDRPGVGDSTSHRYNGLSEWANDVAAVADTLNAETFGLVGLSGGGPYVLATAYTLPKRVAAAVTLGGVAPVVGQQRASGGLLALAANLHGTFEAISKPTSFALSKGIRVLHPIADLALTIYARLGPEADGAVLRVPHMKEMFLDDILVGSMHQMEAMVHDMILFTKEWDIPITDISVPVLCVQGDDDMYVPLSHGAHLASLIPNAQLSYHHGTGHLDGFYAANEACDFILKYL